MEVLTVCFILGRSPWRLLLVTRLMLSSIYLFIFLFFPNMLVHDWDWFNDWFASSFVMNKWAFESVGLTLESEGLLFIFKSSIYFDKLCNERNEFVTKPSSYILFIFFYFWLVTKLSSNLSYLEKLTSLLVDLSILIVSFIAWVELLIIVFFKVFLEFEP